MPEPNDPVDHYGSLKNEIDGYISYSQRWAAVWATIYYTLRGSLIVLSACVAAKDTVKGLSSAAAVLSLIVAIGTAVDTWLKTGNRYRGHYVYNDKFIALYTDLGLTGSYDTTKIENLEQQFKKTVEDYAVAVLPE